MFFLHDVPDCMTSLAALSFYVQGGLTLAAAWSLIFSKTVCLHFVDMYDACELVHVSRTPTNVKLCITPALAVLPSSLACSFTD